ncbi:MAG: helix-turn-helix transcriptional regulator [Ignavibacteria bacterium]|nr:helix-turn-helix transcriptional regulator [Ignavibacteria bacterium]
MKKKLKNTIKVFRAMNDLTQEDLSKLVGVTRKTINTIENGVYVPSTYLALKLAAVLGTTVEKIFAISEEINEGESAE